MIGAVVLRTSPKPQALSRRCGAVPCIRSVRKGPLQCDGPNHDAGCESGAQAERGRKWLRPDRSLSAALSVLQRAHFDAAADSVAVSAFPAAGARGLSCEVGCESRRQNKEG